MKLRLVFATVGLFAACSSQVSPPAEIAFDEMPVPSAGYVENFDHLPVRGPMVLFFPKPTDPFSVRNDLIIRAVYGSGAATVPTYRLDFDSSTGARLRYAVFVEDTFVIVSGSGTTQSIVHPTKRQIQDILKTGRLTP